ncbi:hypothetical protein NQZ68_014987 [Dissostichus eleginoides]|nr:hypothetical protein NQZ68_014987 [Dissostichus eleginoides]
MPISDFTSLSLYMYLQHSASLPSVDVTALRQRRTERAQLPPQTETLWLWDSEEFRRVGFHTSLCDLSIPIHVEPTSELDPLTPGKITQRSWLK